MIISFSYKNRILYISIWQHRINTKKAMNYYFHLQAANFAETRSNSTNIVPNAERYDTTEIYLAINENAMSVNNFRSSLVI